MALVKNELDELVEVPDPPAPTELDMSHSEKYQYSMAPAADYNDPNQEHYHGVKDPELVKPTGKPALPKMKKLYKEDEG